MRMKKFYENLKNFMILSPENYGTFLIPCPET
jgi:hypothetical protein